MQQHNAQKLLEKYTAGLCTEEEKAMIENWYLIMPEEGGYPELSQIERAKKETWTLLSAEKVRRHRTGYLRMIGVAAAVLICLGTAFYLSPLCKGIKGSGQELVVHDIAPGGNKATLILADGRKVTLDDASNGQIAEESGIIITKTAEGQLRYNITAIKSVNPTAYNTVVTPRGGQYQVMLPDGTKVWLNASSSLKFPAAFGTEGRKVELAGEAYFEVARNERLPFKVTTDKQEVVVLGTHFNINSYADETDTRTTLFEGSVKVTCKASSAVKVLKPGQQAVLEGKEIAVASIDTDEALAWKNGLFIFNNEELESIMRKVSRWYNVTVEYKDDQVRKEAFGGSVSRFGNVSEILRMLEITGNVRFTINGNKIIVMKSSRSQ